MRRTQHQDVARAGVGQVHQPQPRAVGRDQQAGDGDHQAAQDVGVQHRQDHEPRRIRAFPAGCQAAHSRRLPPPAPATGQARSGRARMATGAAGSVPTGGGATVRFVRPRLRPDLRRAEAGGCHSRPAPTPPASGRSRAACAPTASRRRSAPTSTTASFQPRPSTSAREFGIGGEMHQPARDQRKIGDRARGVSKFHR